MAVNIKSKEILLKLSFKGLSEDLRGQRLFKDPRKIFEIKGHSKDL